MRLLYPLRLTLALLLLVGAVTSMSAATIVVTNSNDSGAGSLRLAVTNAASGDVIRFAPSTDGTLIVLDERIIISGKTVTVIGNGMMTTLLGSSGEDRIFSVVDEGTLHLRRVSLQDGVAPRGGAIRVRSGSTLTVSGVRIMNCEATGNGTSTLVQGGGAIATEGFVSISNCLLMNNRATGTLGSGGAILISPLGNLRAINSTITGNEANRAGGGIEDASGGTADITILKAVNVTNNVVNMNPGNGGGIHVGGDGNINIFRGTISGNTAAAEGGGVWLGTGSLTVRLTTIENNEAQGGLPSQGGGGLFNDGGTMVVNPGTIIRGNTATGFSGSGGGIFNGSISDADGNLIAAGNLRVNAAKVVGNTANRAGGGIEDASGASTRVAVVNAMIDSNVVLTNPGNGGGIHISGAGNMIVFAGSVSGNTAGAEGGGLWNGTGEMTIRNTVIDGNVAAGDDADQGGGGIYNNGGTLLVNPGTQIVNNEATGVSGSGGGIFNGSTVVDETTIAGNLRVNNATVASNTAMRAGGGIEDASGASSFFRVLNARIDSNTVMTNPGNGGGVHITGDGNSIFLGGSVSGNTAGAEGGGLWNNVGTMTVRKVLIAENTASGDDATQGGGGIFNNGGTLVVNPNTQIINNNANGLAGSGGGIFNALATIDGIEFPGTLTVNNATISNNSAVRAGGGIEDASGEESTFDILNARVDSNSVASNPGNGGGIHIGGTGNLTARTSLVRGNSATSEGGGIWVGSGTVTVSGGTIADNTASGVTSTEGGGGLYADGGTLLIDGATITDNLAISEEEGAAGSGGGILLSTGSSLSLNASTLTGNMANRAGGAIEDASGATGTTVITNSTIDGNSAMSNPGNGGAIHVGSDGDLSITGGSVSGNTAATEGGGLWNGTGIMTIADLTVTGNIAQGDGTETAIQGGGGIYNNGGSVEIIGATTITDNSAIGAAGSGGGILSAGDADVVSTRSIVMQGGSISGNSAVRAGGGVEIVLGDFTSTAVTFDGNSTGAAPGNGGALHVTGTESTVDINGGAITNNTAANEGGGMWNMMGSTMELTNVSITGNEVFNASPAEGQLLAGGGAYNNGGDMNLVSSTVANNTVTTGDGTEPDGAGGGIANAGTTGDFSATTSTIVGNSAEVGGGLSNVSTVNITNSTITDNSATTAGGGISQGVAPGAGSSTAVLTIQGSILSGNTAPTDPNISRGEGTTVSAGFNFFGTVASDDIEPDMGNGDIMGTDAQLGMLMDNGGMTQTVKPDCGSPVIGAGNPEDNTPDQLGQAVNGARDIGSFEVQDACGSIVGQQQDIPKSSNLMAADSDDIEVYPNPVRGQQLSVTLPTSYVGEVTLRIMDASGRIRQTVTQQGAGTRALQLDTYKDGSYILQIVDGNHVENVRFVVSR